MNIVDLSKEKQDVVIAIIKYLSDGMVEFAVEELMSKYEDEVGCSIPEDVEEVLEGCIGRKNLNDLKYRLSIRY
jgi:hypothetical protein